MIDSNLEFTANDTVAKQIPILTCHLRPRRCYHSPTDLNLTRPQLTRPTVFVHMYNQPPFSRADMTRPSFPSPSSFRSLYNVLPTCFNPLELHMPLSPARWLGALHRVHPVHRLQNTLLQQTSTYLKVPHISEPRSSFIHHPLNTTCQPYYDWWTSYCRSRTRRGR